MFRGRERATIDPMQTNRKTFIALSVVLLAAALPAGAPRALEIPWIFDTHVHYSADAWDQHTTERVIERLKAAGVRRALVSSTPDEGSVRLHHIDPKLFVPELRPYHDGIGQGSWYRDPSIPAYLKQRLALGVHRGIGEFHLNAPEHALSNVLAEVARLAIKHAIPLHIHSDVAPIRVLLDFYPTLKILWAHAGFTEGADVVGEMLDRYDRLWTEVSYRAGDIAPNGIDPQWRALLVRHADRFMIGSDTWTGSRWDEYTELIAEHRAWLSELPADVARAIAHENAERLYGGTD
ncbi:MAG: amidohydrolase family protein [Rhodospirillaceae bacterium]|nr:amidohydrolase family protein [Rhodospirillaceae bacterium]